MSTPRIEQAIAELAEAISEFEGTAGDVPVRRWITEQSIRAFVVGQLEGWTMTITPPEDQT